MLMCTFIYTAGQYLEISKIFNIIRKVAEFVALTSKRLGKLVICKVAYTEFLKLLSPL